MPPLTGMAHPNPRRVPAVVTISFPFKVRITFAVVLLLGAALSVFVSWNGRSVLAVSRPLLAEQLPLLALISELQLRMAEQEPILYEYYATTDRATYRQRFARNDEAIEQELGRLSTHAEHAQRIAHIRESYQRMRVLAGALDDTLRVYGDEAVDWDRARDVLVEVSRNGREVNHELAAIASAVRDAVSSGGRSTYERVESVITAVLAFSAVIAVIAGFIGYYVSMHVRAAAERHKLAMFVEKNPNPVLRLTLDGAVLYANPGAADLLAQIGRAGQPAAALVLADIGERQQQLLAAGRHADRFEYTLGERVLDCTLRYLPEHEVFHCYLSDITERKRSAAQLRHQALHDAVLALPNRRYLENTLASLNPSGPAALLLVNVDRFRQLLSDVGPEVGDDVLRAVAGRLAHGYPEGTTPPPLYRFEGDTFALLVLGSDAKPLATDHARGALSALEQPFYVEGREIFLSASIGASLFPAHGTEPAELLRNAGAALHAVKQAGGNSFLVYNEDMTARAAQRLSLEADLRRALEREELFLNLQPQVELRAGRIIGGEALLRWRRAGQGLVSPAQFIPLAEETGLIMPIGEWVLRQACRAASAWTREGCSGVAVAINISARQFQRPGLARLVREVLAETALDPAALELEITEGSAMHDLEHTVHTLRDLKDLGVALAIDDFGTGFSSLSYLSRFPLDRLKLDQSFVRGLGVDQSAEAIAAAVLTLGHSLGLRVIAEGVETPDQLRILRALGCDEMQGFLFSKPLSLEDFAGCLAAGRCLAPAAGETGDRLDHPGLSTLP